MDVSSKISKSSFVIWLLFLVIVMISSTKGNINLPTDPKDGTFQSEVDRINLQHKEILSTRDQVRNDLNKKMHKVKDKTKLVLDSLSESYRLQTSLKFRKPNTAVAVGSCDTLGIFEDILVLAVRTTNYTFGIITDGALIVADFSTCLTQFNPFGSIKCFYNLFQAVPNLITAIIENTKYFTQSVKELVPEIYHKLKSCYGHDVADYLNNLSLAVGQVAARSKLKLLQE